MSRHTCSLIVIMTWLAAVCSGATDPFVGKWKLNLSESKVADQITIQVAGKNMYTLAFSGSGETETVAADGTDQPGVYGTTLSITAEDAGTWKIVRKKNGSTLLQAIWKLSGDGKTMSDAFTSYQPDGSGSTVTMVYERTAGKAGLPGTWETEDAKAVGVYELEIRPYEGDGLSFIASNSPSPKNMKFDGKEYRNPAGAGLSIASTGSRIGHLALEITDKINGKILYTRQVTLSPDLRTLTMVLHPAGQRLPNTLVFDRE